MRACAKHNSEQITEKQSFSELPFGLAMLLALLLISMFFFFGSLFLFALQQKEKVNNNKKNGHLNKRSGISFLKQKGFTLT
jgi:hypothetical protein